MNYNQFSNPSGGYNSDNPKSDGYGGIITPPADKTSVAPFNIPIPRSSKRDVFDFWPSQNGLKYSNNDWPTDVPYFSIPVTLFGISFVIPVGHASDGMCGGMAYAVRDLYEAGILPPTSRMNPIPNSPAWNFLYARLVQSFNIPLGILKYITWMDYKRHAVAVGANGVSG